MRTNNRRILIFPILFIFLSLQAGCVYLSSEQEGASENIEVVDDAVMRIML